MSVQNLKYTKVSELTAADSASDSDVIIINHGGNTCKISVSDFKNSILAGINSSLTGINSKIDQVSAATNENTTSLTDINSKIDQVSAATNENTTSINNIITAGFNLIGIDKES